MNRCSVGVEGYFTPYSDLLSPHFMEMDGKIFLSSQKGLLKRMMDATLLFCHKQQGSPEESEPEPTPPHGYHLLEGAVATFTVKVTEDQKTLEIVAMEASPAIANKPSHPYQTDS